MPWKETGAMEERVRLIRDYRIREWNLAELCRSYGISRKTGYKWILRAEQEGLAELGEHSRAPHHHPNAVNAEMAELILEARGRHSTWGPKKLRALLEREQPKLTLPAVSTIGEILRRSGLSAPRKRRRRAEPSARPFAAGIAPNEVWCADFKGWFLTRDGRRVDPLTISDAASRFLIRCQALPAVTLEGVQRLFAASFREYGLPRALRTDNGSPFASHGIGGLSRLSVWWIRLGITPERIEPGQPQQNGRHERMHRTLKQETTRPPAASWRAQQGVFDRFREEYNRERPHEALGMETPAAVYEPSPRPYPARLPEVEYPAGMEVRRVQKRGEFHWQGHPVFLTEALAGQRIGLDQRDDRYYEIYLAHVPVARFDSQERRALRRRGA